jgi:hypothetical protein
MSFDLFKLKHWQVFLLLVGLLIAIALVRSLITFLLPWWFGVPFDLLTTVVMMSYPLLAWHRLLPQAGSYISQWTEPNTIRLAVVAVVGVQVLVYLVGFGFIGNLLWLAQVAGWIIIIAAPARLMKSIELGRNAEVSDFIPEALLFFIWPIGVFWLQPRLAR